MNEDRPEPLYPDFLRRLRNRPVSSWAVSGRVEATRAALDQLALRGFTTELPGHPVPPVPDVGVHALADQLEVLLRDAARAGVKRAELDVLIEELAGVLGVRRH